MGLTVEDILYKTNNGLDVFKYYLGNRFIRLRKPFKSPFYEDSKASCNVYLDRNSNRYKFKDFGENMKPVDCFGFVCRQSNLEASDPSDFIKVLKLISYDLNLGVGEHKIIHYQDTKLTEFNKVSSIETNSSWEDNIDYQEFTKAEFEYWNSFGVSSQTLIKYRVRSVKKYSGISNSNKPYTLRSRITQPIFAYYFETYVKLYQPYSKFRFLYLGLKPESYIFGFEQLPLKGDLLFITGGEKDVLSIAAKDLNAISFNSETANIPQIILKELSQRFNNIVLLYDCDHTGIKSMNSIIEANKGIKLLSITLPLTGSKDDKDVSDFFKKGNSKEDLIALFASVIEQSYSGTLSYLKTCEVRLDKPPLKQAPTLLIDKSSIGSPGNLVGITGTEGSGKSNFIAGVIAGCLNPNNQDIDTLGMSIEPNIKSKAVVIYDTEQSENQLYDNIDSVKRRAHLDKLPSWFKAYSLVSLNRKERLKAILESIHHFYFEFGGIHLIVIDGIADLIGSVNDEEQSVDLINKLFQLAGHYNTVIVCLLHLNPGGYKLRGHLGSELQRKAAGVLSVERRLEQNYSVVKTIKLREASPLETPTIQFSWNEELNQHSFICYLNSNSKRENKINQLKEFAKNMFEDKTSITSYELNNNLMDYFEIKDRMARNYIKLMRVNSIIKKDSQLTNSFFINRDII